MKKSLLPFLLLVCLAGQSQTYNNEWINYNLTYYKFKVGATSFFRISQPTLASIGIGNAPAEQFQLWRNGQEIPLYTSVQTGVLGSSDYIEFWGEANDGKPDLALYRNPDFQLNDKWSLETDTAAFFLTVNPTGVNKRLIPAVNSLPSALLPEPYFMCTVGKYYKDKLNPGYAAVVGEYVYSSAYDQGEGYTSTDFAGGANRTFNFTGLYPSTATGVPDPVLKVNAIGNALNPRQFEVSVNSNLVATETMDFFDYKRSVTTIAPSIISSGAANVVVKNTTTALNDRMLVATIELTYARQFNVGNVTSFQFELPANPAGNYLEISGLVTGNVSPLLYDLTNGKRYVGDISTPSKVKINLEPSATARKLILISLTPANVKTITSFQERNFIDYSQTANQGNYLIVSHPALTTATNGNNPVEDYKAYRSSVTGGSYNAKVYWIDEIIDQFGFGIKKNPLGLRNFIHWARNTFDNPVKDVLLLGRGMSYVQYRTFENKPDVEQLAYIPTWGYPASDNSLAIDPSIDLIPKVGIGRISAIYGDEIEVYLEKLKEYEQQQQLSSPLIRDKAWLKNAVNVIGASDPALGNILTADMTRYQNIITDTLMGANMNTFSKVSAAPVEQASTERLYGLFEEGIGLMTYFGHSSATTLEFNLDNPDQYNNQGKYPVTIVMGCNAGNFFNYSTLRFLAKETLSEKFVLAPNRGSIAFVASTHFGIVHYLDILNTQTMRAATGHMYGHTIGEIYNESFKNVYNITTENDYYARFHCEQTTLHGDPAIRLDMAYDKPDYVIEDQLVKVSPAFVSVAETSFRVDAKMMNLGKAPDKSIIVEAKRTYPDLTTEIIRRDTIPGIRFIDSLTYDIPIVATRDKGLNKISIYVDADYEVDELYETNNGITKDIFVFEDEARPVYPYNYAIINRSNIKLMASTANPFSPVKQYVMEIDTTEFFNSPTKATQTISSTGGLLEFNPGLALTDSTVYYWRVAPVPTTGSPVWNKSSFVYLSPSGPNSSDYGFNQSHFYQHTKSEIQNMKWDSASRKLGYKDVYNNLFLRMGTWVTSGATQEVSLSVSVNGIPYIRVTAWFQSLVYNVFDPISFTPWENTVIRPATNFPADLGEGRYKSLSPQNLAGTVRQFNFEYRYTSPTYRKNAMNFMKDTIPDGYYVVVRNFSLDPVTFPNATQFPQVFINQWMDDTLANGSGNSLYHYLKNAGFTGIDSFYRVRPWGFVYKKNDPSFTPEWLVGVGPYDNPTFSVDCPTPDTLGYITSPLFGPAKAWKDVKWRGKSDALTGEEATLDVIGVSQSGAESTLFSNMAVTQQDFSIATIDPVVYPYVKLKLRTLDTTNFTPYELRYWRVTYDPVPEGAIAPNIFFSMKDTVDVGEPNDVKVGFKNVSDAAFDSLKVKLVITDRNNVPHIVPLPRKRPMLVNDSLQIGGLVNTSTLSGANTVYIEANPDQDQPEQYHFNNFAFRDMYVKPDSLDPLLDVTFDGVHILNRDIVSARPDILIKLMDEAKWMILDDTSLLTVQVRFPDGALRRYFFNNDTLQFFAAGQAPNNDNTATINFRPYFLADGEYELIVSGKDRSENAAGNIEYRVVFEVINKPMISNMLNYPNPFTTSTAFVFTITGSEVPQNIKIEIMTVTGRIVREITKDELGPLNIGRNITQFKWDGTDQYGDKLANGIYLYRVVTNLNGKSLDKYKAQGDNTDKYFNKGYGKMYLMR